VIPAIGAGRSILVPGDAMKKSAVRRLIGSLAATAATVAGMTPGAHAGAWLQKPGSFYFKTGVSHLFAEDEFTAGGDRVPILALDSTVTNTSFKEIAVSTYLEYGLSERLTLMLKIPYKYMTSTRTEVSSNFDLLREVEAINGGLSDMRIGARFPLVQKKVLVSVEGYANVPLAYDPTPSNNGSPLGNGKLYLDGVLTGGLNLFPYGYAGIEVGYRIHTSDLADVVGLAAEYGASYWRLFGKMRIDGQISTGTIRDNAVSSTSVVNNETVWKLMPELDVHITGPLSAYVEVFHVLSGKRTVAGTTYGTGIVVSR